MLKLIPEPDGSVAIYRTRTGKLLGYAHDQAHAEDWVRRYEAIMRGLAPLVWEAGRALWQGMTPEERRYYSQPRPEQVESIERAA